MLKHTKPSTQTNSKDLITLIKNNNTWSIYLSMHLGGGWIRYSKTISNNPFFYCCDVAVAQINYPNLKHNIQDNIEQARGRYHEEGSS
jgi:hypothetical protein